MLINQLKNMTSGPIMDTGKVVDLSGLNFEALEKLFLKIQNKNTAVQCLKDKVEKQLKRMIEENPLRVDFYKLYNEIIEEYNNGKEKVTIEETFRKLVEFVNELSEEEAETKREGLSEEQKAIFDILRHGKELSAKEKNGIKNLSIELLDNLKKEKLRVEKWSDKTLTSAAVYNTERNTLFESLPHPTY